MCSGESNFRHGITINFGVFPDALSINSMVTLGTKIWIVTDSSIGNYKVFREKFSRTVTKAKFKSGCPEQAQFPCENSFMGKTFFVSLKFLVENQIKFGIIIQEVGDTVITSPFGAHQIVNFSKNVSFARNIVTEVHNARFL